MFSEQVRYSRLRVIAFAISIVQRSGTRATSIVLEEK